MSNYQHNINGPHFPAGAHVAHYSLANTTLIGQEVQHRLWEKHWGEQFPAPPPLYMWCQPGICLHNYPYGLPPTFCPVYAKTGSDQSEHPVLLSTPRQEKSSDAPDKTFTAKSDNSLVGTLQKTKTLTRNTTTTSKLTQVFNSVGHKALDPVTEDLNWNIFSSDLADGIVVSILDSFISELPVLDITMVQSVLQEIDKHLSQDEAQSKNSSVKKLDYFSDIESLPCTQQTCSDEISSEEAGGLGETTGNSDKLENCTTLSEAHSFSNICGEEGNSSQGLHTIGKTFQEEEDSCSDVTIVNPDTSNTNEIETLGIDSNLTDGQTKQIASDDDFKEEQT